MEIEFSTKTHLEEHLEYYTNNIHTLNEPNTVLLRRSIIEYYIQLKKKTFEAIEMRSLPSTH